MCKDDKIIVEGDHDFITGMWIVTILYSLVLPLITPSPSSTNLSLDIESDMPHILLSTTVPVSTNRKHYKIAPTFCTLLFPPPLPQTFINAIKPSSPIISRKMKQLLFVVLTKPGKMYTAR